MATPNLTINRLINQVFPNGTVDQETSVEEFPQWPPDLFAFCAKTIELCDSYTEILVAESRLSEIATAKDRKELVNCAKIWLETENVSPAVLDYWNTVLESRDEFISDWKGTKWIDAVHRLLIIADEASAGIGFPGGKNTWVKEMYSRVNKENPDITAKQPTSCCYMVPVDVACVQPKTRTPQVGCTLRSLSHHLALLPASTSVEVRWHPANSLSVTQSILDDDTFNLLIIPFPYEIHATSIKGRSDKLGINYFDFDQSWVAGKEDETVEFISDVVTAGQKDAGQINGVILPELALNELAYSLLAEELQGLNFNGLQFLVSGVKSETRNSARTTFFADRSDGKRIPWHRVQHKHHRWRLDSAQISTYALGSNLNSERIWWEDIDIGHRSLDFFIFRRGSCFSTLICEDLARVDPCQPILRAIGPNLLIALLMDGPQLRERWPGRYAMSLADDPGCSVLSVTSMGLIRRSAHRHGRNDIVALWRDPYGETLELPLEANSSAILMSLARSKEQEFTLDGRGDGEAAYSWKISGTTPIGIKPLET